VSRRTLDYSLIDMESIIVEQMPEKKPKKGCAWFFPLFGLHNQARVVSVALVMFCVAVWIGLLEDWLKFDLVQEANLYVASICVGALLVGTFASFYVFYIPAVYVMRIAMVKMMFYNTYLIIKLTGELETFAVSSRIASRDATVRFLNRNFSILQRCLMLSVEAWICLLVFLVLHSVITKEFHRLRNKACKYFVISRRFGNFVGAQSQRLFSRPKNTELAKEGLGLESGMLVPAKVQEAAKECTHPVQQRHNTDEIILETKYASDYPPYPNCGLPNFDEALCRID